MRKYSNIFKFFRIYEQIFEYIRWSKNLRMNFRIYSYWGNCTNTNTADIQGPFYLNIRIFQYPCSSLVMAEPHGGESKRHFDFHEIICHLCFKQALPKMCHSPKVEGGVGI